MAAERARCGLLVDFGGVLTTDVFASFAAFCRAEGLAEDAVRDAFRSDPGARGLLEDLECGRLAEELFEPRFAAVLGVHDAGGLIDRLFAGMRADAAMVAGVAAARHAGVRTGLLSNSWGRRLYDRERLDPLFDAVVISGEEGMRKPEPAIYALAASRLGVPPADCVFVDDLRSNLEPARALGMATVLHREAGRTLRELERLLGVEVSRPENG